MMGRMMTRLALVAVLVGGCTGGTQAPKEPDPGPVSPVASVPVVASTASTASQAPDADPRVCCESFGYGARMVECCSKFTRVKADECKLPPGFVGGGKRVVDDVKCQ
jgi:hypothetical protein